MFNFRRILFLIYFVDVSQVCFGKEKLLKLISILVSFQSSAVCVTIFKVQRMPPVKKLYLAYPFFCFVLLCFHWFGGHTNERRGLKGLYRLLGIECWSDA